MKSPAALAEPEPAFPPLEPKGATEESQRAKAEKTPVKAEAAVKGKYRKSASSKKLQKRTSFTETKEPNKGKQISLRKESI